VAKKKRVTKPPATQHPPTYYFEKIKQSLQADFSCSPEQIAIIEHVLQGFIPDSDIAFIHQIERGEAKPLDWHPFILDTGDGTEQVISFPNTPLNLMMDYLSKKYEEKFGFLYWCALTDMDSPQRYHRDLSYFKRHVPPDHFLKS